MVGHCSVRTIQATGEEREKRGEKRERRGQREREGESSQRAMMLTFESFAGSLRREFIYYDIL